MKLLRFGKGPKLVKKANAYEVAAFWKRPGACEEGPMPVKLVARDTLT